MEQLINNNWSFCKLQSGSHFADVCAADFRPIDIPHDWLIGQDNLYETSDGWYRRNIKIENKEKYNFILRFDGVYMDAAVFVNGVLLTGHAYGYTAFDCDITRALHDGNNEVHVQVRYQCPNSRWYSGAGIFRDVTLHTLPNRHIALDGVYVTPEIKVNETGATYANIIIDTQIEDFDACTAHQTLTHRLFDGEGACVAQCTDSVTNAGTHTCDLSLDSPKLWGCEHPYVYRLISSLGSQEIKQNMGFRTIEMTTDSGFYLNGEPLKLKGVCLHHDLGALGAAYNRSAARRQLRIMQQMGVNALRTAHNPPAKHVMELCDEMGILVISEAFDMWQRSKTIYDYARFFDQYVRSDVRSWVRRDRNRPSLIMWSIGNEIVDTHIDEQGQVITRMLMDEVALSDPRQHAPVTIGSNYMPWENAQKCADIVGLAGYNYGEKYYEAHHEQYPHWIIYGSETASVLSSRGIYHFPLEASILSDSDLQCSALGNSTASWGAKSLQKCIVDDLNTPYSLGQFIWSGIDYIGEPTPYHTRSCYFGQVDTAGFAKDGYYVFRSLWTDVRVDPMVHIGVYWDYNLGQLIDVPIYSNAHAVELFVNGVSQGIRQLDRLSVKDCTACYKIPYVQGTLLARAYDAQGNCIAEDERRSFGDAKEICLEPETNIIRADGEDIGFIQISMKDADGNPVYNATNRVRVSVSGEGRLLGLDNGDSTDIDGYQIDSRRLFSGKLLAMVGTTARAGEIQITVSSPGLADKTLCLNTLESGVRDGVQWQRNCPSTHMQREVPARKIEIDIPQSLTITKENPECIVKSRVLPANATHTDISWRVTNQSGIDSPCADVVERDGDIYIRGLGDGMVYLRASCNNGYAHPRILSQVEIRISGMGQPYLDPYGFVAGGLFDVQAGDLGPGNDQGVATARDGQSMFGYKNVDFGSVGADEVTLPIFALTSEPYPIELWCGDPRDAGSEQIGQFTYEKQSIWNTYQAQSFKLDRPIKGVVTLCFVLQAKIHLKGFTFSRRCKAYTQLLAADCQQVYGDSFEKTERGIEGIGNNVSIIYSDLDFDGATRVRLSLHGHTHHQVQPINLRLMNAQGEDLNQLIEFAGHESADIQCFDLKALRGVCTLTLVFLPGSHFDFFDMQFERMA